MARPKKKKSLHRGKRVYIRFTELEYELVARYAKDAGSGNPRYHERQCGKIDYAFEN